MNASSPRHIRLIVVSPGDVGPERDAISRIADELNAGLARARNVFLEVWRWETDAYPGVHIAGPQGHIDDLMRIDDSDIVVGVFWKRFGTPTNDSQSGTAHELKRAFAAWSARGRPQIMIYFSEAQYSPSQVEELEQWKSVLQFRKDLPREVLWWPYADANAFERVARGHLNRALLDSTDSRPDGRSPNPLEPKSGAPGVGETLAVPQFPDAVGRPDSFRRLDGLVGDAGVMAVEGLSGSGKTYLVAGYLASSEGRRRYAFDECLWYQPHTGSTIDDFMIAARALPQGEASGITARCRLLLTTLAERNGVIVIDDFHTVDQKSYAILLELARGVGAPARLILLSTAYTDASYRAAPEHLAAPGFARSEIVALLERRQVPTLTDDAIDRLATQTGALPIALTLFASLVVRFGYEPELLLADHMAIMESLRTWFDKIVSHLQQRETRLLADLSLCDAPFNRGVVRALAQRLDIPDSETTFDALQRAYLLQGYTLFSWRVHPLIAEFALVGVPPAERTMIHKTLSAHFLKGTKTGIDAEMRETMLTYRVRACRHLQQAGDGAGAERLILDLAKLAKSLGLYDLLVQLCRTQIQNSRQRDRWIDYHCAHCCLITGRIRDALADAEAAYYSTDGDERLRLSLARVCAEALWAMGATEEALSRIRTELSRTKDTARNAVVRAQARNVEALLLLDLGQTDGSDQIANELLGLALKQKDYIGTAIASVLLGVSARTRGDFAKSRASLELALRLFRDREDLRGISWAHVHLALSKSAAGEDADADALHAVEIRAKLGECSTEYRDQLRQLIEMIRTPHIAARLRQELDRVEKTLRL